MVAGTGKMYRMDLPDTLTDKDIQGVLHPGRSSADGRKLSNFEYIHTELAKPRITLSLLWAEYCVQCEAEHVIPYQHSQFNERYHVFAVSTKATLRIKRKPGELIEVDWAGNTLSVY